MLLDPNIHHQEIPDFSYRDLSGKSFKKRSLQGAAFQNIKTGLKLRWKSLSCLLVFIIGSLLGFISALICYFLLEVNFLDNLSGIGILITVISFWWLFRQTGLEKSVAWITSFVAIYGTFMGGISIVTSSPSVGISALLFAATFTILLGCIFLGIVCCAGVRLTIGKWMIVWLLSGALLSGSAVSILGRGPIGVLINESGLLGVILTLLIVFLLTSACKDMGNVVLLDLENAELRSLLRWSITWSTLGNTNFRNADLTEADFSNANLTGADFSHAKLHHINWFGAKKLSWARWDSDSPLSNPKVVQILTNKKGVSYDCSHLNLSFTNLTSADLRDLDFKGSNLTGANLQNANLEGTNLSDIRAIGTDFRGAKLTGICLQNWQIDASTRLDNVHCRYVFLSEGYRDRQPASGEFEPGDFAKLYQTVVDTFDLIFRNGLDWKTFQASLDKIRHTNPESNLSVQSVESKGDGYFVVKLQVESTQNKEHIHQLLKQEYADRLQRLEEKYRQRLAQQQDQIGKLINVADYLTQPQEMTNPGQTVLLSFLNGSLSDGFTVSSQVWSRQGTLLFTQVGQLPPAPAILTSYQRWQKIYRAQQPLYQDEFDPTPITNFSLSELNQSAEYLVQQLNIWFESASFLQIDQRLRSTLDPDQKITVTVQTDDITMQQLPLHCWRFFDAYPQASLTLSFLNTRALSSVKRIRSHQRALLVLGLTSELDVKQDQKIMSDLSGVEICVLEQPSMQELTECLWDPQGWDIFCFSGHSALQGNNIWLNAQDAISLDEMKYALRTASQKGLSVSIFNCCQGIRLAQQFSNVVSTGVVVMREPIPDLVAQVFLRYLLESLENHQSLAHSLKFAREQLQGMERDFPCVTWLPVVYWLP